MIGVFSNAGTLLATYDSLYEFECSEWFHPLDSDDDSDLSYFIREL